MAGYYEVRVEDATSSRGHGEALVRNVDRERLALLDCVHRGRSRWPTSAHREPIPSHKLPRGEGEQKM
jgi:hypothetical protein